MYSGIFWRHAHLFCELNILSVADSDLCVSTQIDSPVSPGAKGSSQFLSNITADLQQMHRDGIFAVGKDSLVNVAER